MLEIITFAVCLLFFSHKLIFREKKKVEGEAFEIIVTLVKTPHEASPLAENSKFLKHAD